MQLGPNCNPIGTPPLRPLRQAHPEKGPAKSLKRTGKTLKNALIFCYICSEMKTHLLLLTLLFTVLPAATRAWTGRFLPQNEPLTIDDSLQTLAERLLEGKQGSIVAIDPLTGEVRCMASSSYTADSVNRAISVAYSPGSTYKVAQGLTLISENIIGQKSRFSCNEGFWKNNIHIGCHPHRSPLALIEAIGHSCNAYFCKAFMAMIENRKIYKNRRDAVNLWHAYMSSMGLGTPLGIDIEGETGGLMPDAACLDSLHKGRWNATTVMWMGMGQGEVSLTTLQLCNLAAAIANRGWYITPHIRPVNHTAPDAGKYLIRHKTMASAHAYDLVIQGMRHAIVSGTAAMINRGAYKICGKTGTAENPNDDHSAFIGFAPMEKPRLCVAVYVENGGFGADLAAPIAALLLEQYLTGKLSDNAEYRARQWQSYAITPPQEKAKGSEPAQEKAPK